jgi:4-methyl-5(b-hydroxyethyl)-thiazole monophosphate biosynthesis
MASALVILADGFEEIEAVTPIDVLRRAEVEVTVAGLNSHRAAGAHGVDFVGDCELDAVSEKTFDAVILPGGMPGSKNLGESEMVKQIVIRHNEAGKIVAAICAAPAFALAKFGVLDGKRATCFPGCEAEFGSTVTNTAASVEVDGNIITSKGAGTASHFAFELVKHLVDEKTADDLRVRMLY